MPPAASTANTSPRPVSGVERERKVSMRLHRGAPVNMSSSDLTGRQDTSRMSTSQVRAPATGPLRQTGRVGWCRGLLRPPPPSCPFPPPFVSISTHGGCCSLAAVHPLVESLGAKQRGPRLPAMPGWGCSLLCPVPRWPWGLGHPDGDGDRCLSVTGTRSLGHFLTESLCWGGVALRAAPVTSCGQRPWRASTC